MVKKTEETLKKSGRRPKKEENIRKYEVKSFLDQFEKERFDEMCHVERYSASECIRVALKEYYMIWKSKRKALGHDGYSMGR